MTIAEQISDACETGECLEIDIRCGILCVATEGWTDKRHGEVTRYTFADSSIMDVGDCLGWVL